MIDFSNASVIVAGEEFRIEPQSCWHKAPQESMEEGEESQAYLGTRRRGLNDALGGRCYGLQRHKTVLLFLPRPPI